MLHFLTLAVVISKITCYEWVKLCNENDQLIIDQLYSDKVLVSYCKMLQVHKNHTLGLPISRLCTIFRLVKHRNIDCYFGDLVKNVLGNEKFKVPTNTDSFFDKIYLMLSVLSVMYLLWVLTPLSKYMVTSILNRLKKKSNRNIERSVPGVLMEQIV